MPDAPAEAPAPVRTIARKELREALRDGRFRTLAVLLLVLAAVAIFTGARAQQRDRDEREAARAAVRTQWLEQGDKNPHSAAHYGQLAFRPVGPLAFLDAGVDPYGGIALWLEAHRRNDAIYRPSQDGAALLRFGALDAATLAQLLLPLLVVLLGFAAFSGEREQGTWRQLRSLGVAPRTLLLGKALGLSGALLAVMVPLGLLLTAGALLAATAPLGETLVRLLLLGAAYLVYGATFLGLALAVSARASTSRVALVVLLGLWILNGLIAPRLTADVARSLAPLPSASERAARIARDIAEGLDDDGTVEQRRAQARQQILAEHGVRRVEALPFDINGRLLQADEEYRARVFDRDDAERLDLTATHARVESTVALLAPLMALRPLSMALAGTAPDDHRTFARAAELHRRSVVAALNEATATGGASPGTAAVGDRSLWETIPAPRIPQRTAADTVAAQLGNAGVLALWLVLAWVAAFAAVARIHVREDDTGGRRRWLSRGGRPPGIHRPGPEPTS